MFISMTPHGESGKVLHCSQDDKDRKFEIQLYDEKSVIDGFIEQLYFPTYKGGTEQLLPINTSTPTTSNFRGTIEYPSGEIESEFVYRESPTNEDGRAKITEIKGNTIKFNQLVQNGNFADTSVWGDSNASHSISNNICSFTASSQYGGIVQTLSVPANHYVYLSAKIKTSVPTDQIQVLTLRSGGNAISKLSIATTDWQTVSVVGLSLYEILSFVVRDNRSSDRNAVQVTNCMCSDLTAIFGTGNEPTTVEQFETWLSTHIGKLDYYGFTLGDLISFKGTGLKIVGKNLCDISSFTHEGVVNDSGAIATSANRLYSPMIRVIPSRDYTYKIVGTLNGEQIFVNRIIGYDANGNFIRRIFINDYGTNTFTMPTDFVFIVLDLRNRSLNNIEISNITSIQLEIGTQATDYEPYTETTLSLPTLDYFPTGMKSAGTAFDRYDGKRADKVMSEPINLGDLNYYILNNRFVCDDLTNAKAPATNFDIANIKCAIYKADSVGNVYQGIENMTIGLSIPIPPRNVLRIWINNTNYTDVATFKQAMNGVYLIYELANPIITKFKSASLVCKGTELSIYNNEVSLIEDVTQEAGTFDCKVKLQDGDDVAYSEKLSLFVERKPL